MNNPSSISTKQNELDNLGLLAAADEFYAKAKRSMGWQFGLTFGTGLIFSPVIVWEPSWLALPSLYFLIVTIADTIWLDSKQTAFKVMAAKAQERFACNVFDLPWNRLLVGDPVGPGDLNQAEARYKKRELQGANAGDPFAKKRGWYTPPPLPLPFARIICQMTDIYWNQCDRQRFAGWVGGLLLLLMLITIVLCAVFRTPGNWIVIEVIVPVLPGANWLWREYKRHREAETRLNELAKELEHLWQFSLADKKGAGSLAQLSREIQNVLFTLRHTQPTLPDWFYAKHRTGRQEELNALTDEHAKEVMASTAFAHYVKSGGNNAASAT